MAIKDNYSKVLLALLLSNQNRSLRIQSVHLHVDERDYIIRLNTDFANGDIIIYAEKKFKDE